jgi:hypothetical protein
VTRLDVMMRMLLVCSLVDRRVEFYGDCLYRRPESLDRMINRGLYRKVSSGQTSTGYWLLVLLQQWKKLDVKHCRTCRDKEVMCSSVEDSYGDKQMQLSE